MVNRAIGTKIIVQVIAIKILAGAFGHNHYVFLEFLLPDGNTLNHLLRTFGDDSREAEAFAENLKKRLGGILPIQSGEAAPISEDEEIWQSKPIVEDK